MAQDVLFHGIDLKSYLDRWAKLTIEKWQEQLTAQNIGVSFELKRSFENEVRTSAQGAAEIALKFRMYGRFRDMGVGRGLKANERASNSANRSGRRAGANVSAYGHRPKKWLNKIAAHQTYRLSELLNNRATETLINNFNNTNNINIQLNG